MASQVVHAPLLTVGEAAKYLGVGRKVLYRLIEDGELPALRSGPATLVKRQSLDRFKQSGRLT